jgi:DNA-binding XRE family transcriptional regulator
MKQIIVERLHKKFIKLVDEFLYFNDIQKMDLAKDVGISPQLFSQLMSPDIKSRRKLSIHYCQLFITAGVFTADDIYDNKPESNEEKRFWRLMQIAEFDNVLDDLFDLKDMGVNIPMQLRLLKNKLMAEK